MPGSRRKQPPPEQVLLEQRQLLLDVLRNIKRARESGLEYVNEIKEALEENLGSVYRQVHQNTDLLKGKFRAKVITGNVTANHDLDYKAVNGLNTFFSTLAGVNDQEKHLFRDTLKGKLAVIMSDGHSSAENEDTDLLKNYAETVNFSLKNLHNMKHAFERHLQFVNTLNGKSNSFEARLREQCRSLEKILLEQIRITETLQAGLNNINQNDNRPTSPGKRK